MSNRAWGGLILLLLFVAVMSRCDSDSGCEGATNEYAFERCQEMRP